VSRPYPLLRPSFSKRILSSSFPSSPFSQRRYVFRHRRSCAHKIFLTSHRQCLQKVCLSFGFFFPPFQIAPAPIFPLRDFLLPRSVSVTSTPPIELLSCLSAPLFRQDILFFPNLPSSNPYRSFPEKAPCADTSFFVRCRFVTKGRNRRLFPFSPPWILLEIPCD